MCVCVSVHTHTAGKETRNRELQRAAASRAARGPRPIPLPGLNVCRAETAAASDGLTLITEQSLETASFDPFDIRERKRTRGSNLGVAYVFSCLAELCGPAGKVYLEASTVKGWTAGTLRFCDAGSMWATSEAKPGNLGLSWKKKIPNPAGSKIR